MRAYLRIFELLEIGIQVEFDAFGGTRQGNTSNKQHKQYYVWKGCCEIDNLKKNK